MKHKPYIQSVRIISLGAIIALLLTTSKPHASAALIDELRDSIKTKTDEVKRLEAEIKAVDALAKSAGREATTLSKSVKELDAQRKGLEARIELAKKQLSATQTTINDLDASIREKNKELREQQAMIEETVRLLYQAGDASPVTMLMSDGSFSEFWNDTEALEQVQKRLTIGILEAKQIQKELDEHKSQKEKEAQGLQTFKTRIEDQKKIAEATSKEKKQLLSITKSKEETYQKLLADKQKEKAAIERELFDYEAKLRFTLDPSSIPEAGTRFFIWPTEGGVLTQQFGDTAFSRKTAAYNGKGHNGIDIGVGVGTPIYAAADGTIRGSGNTDTTCKGASYGKWILMDHPQNLSSLYAHLSLIKAKAGQSVKAGDLIGYSGNTGYSTGPHLHFSVFASEGVNITELRSKVKTCGTYTLPVASFSSYLNPTNYLP